MTVKLHLKIQIDICNSLWVKSTRDLKSTVLGKTLLENFHTQRTGQGPVSFLLFYRLNNVFRTPLNVL